MSHIRIGQGYDVHALSKGSGITIGGVFISCQASIVAHSDGDVLIHALCDALLGALARGDIGGLFPDSDPAHQGRDSREFLRHIRELLEEDGYSLGNADMTIVAQAPRMAPHVPAMRECLAADLAVDSSRISIKATTTEKLGFCGRQEGIAANAVVLLEKRQ